MSFSVHPHARFSLNLKNLEFYTCNYHLNTSSVDLELAGGDASLSMETLSEVTCPACPSCTGGIYLIYDDETTLAISPNASDLEIESEIRLLSTLGTASVYGNMTWINVSTTPGGAGSLCDSGSAVTTSIRLRCPYGNLPGFTLVNSVRDGTGETVRTYFIASDLPLFSFGTSYHPNGCRGMEYDVFEVQ